MSELDEFLALTLQRHALATTGVRDLACVALGRFDKTNPRRRGRSLCAPISSAKRTQ